MKGSYIIMVHARKKTKKSAGGDQLIFILRNTGGYAPTVGTRPIHVMFMQSDGVVFDGHTRGYAPTVGTHQAHPP